MIQLLRRRSMMEQIAADGYENQYLTFVALASGTFSFSKDGAQYSLDNGVTWTGINANVSTPTVTAGTKIMWRASGITPTNPTGANGGIGHFSATADFDVEGNIMSMCEGAGFRGKTTISNNYQFGALFSANTHIVSAENMVLPATTLATSCYRSMFYNCTLLTTAPSKISATTIATYSCSQMFRGCTSLTTPPELPATTVDTYGYYEMFRGCTSLTTPSALPAENLSTNCYYNMFYGSGLVSAPALPATSLAERCYYQMFYECTSLTTAPELPATTLATYCYYMMFAYCSNLTTAPDLLAPTLVQRCYYGMFYHATKLNYIKCLATSISASYCVNNWVNSVASSGTFVKSRSVNWPSGNNGIPSGWTVQNA